MRKLITTIILIFCCFMICSGTCEAAKKKKVNAKTSFAVISDAKINKKKLKKNEVFEYSFKISLRDSFDYKSKKLEEGPFNKKAKYYYVRVTWKSKKQEVEQTFKWKSTKKKKKIKGKIPVYKGMQTGKWKLYSISIFDYNPDNDDDIYGSILDITDGSKKQQKQDDSDGYAYRDLSFANFKVKGKRKADKQAPTFDKESLSVSKSEVESGEKVTFSVKVEDACKIEKVTCSWEVMLPDNRVWDLDRDMKYNKKTQCYECTLILSDDDMQARLVDIYTKDIYGNSKTYTDWCGIECQEEPKSEYHDAFSKMTIYKK